jgi:hypothetical protein
MSRVQLLILMLDGALALASLPIGWLVYVLLARQFAAYPGALERLQHRGGRVSFALRMAGMTTGLLLLGGLLASLMEPGGAEHSLTLALVTGATGLVSFAGLYAGTLLGTPHASHGEEDGAGDGETT